jgi:aspartyl-tRNA(Asn)/glutamyl-tRNA(Gln) amidotransferase subunit A
VDPQVAARVREAAERLQALGAEVVEIDPGFESPIDIFQKLWFTASQDLCLRCSRDERALLDQGMVEKAKRADAWRAVDLFRAEKARADLSERLEHFNQDYHLLMTPTVPIEPFGANREVPEGSGMRDWEEWAPFSYPFNLSQQPAASVPCGFTERGLPAGFQLAGGKHDDLRVLRAAHAYMRAHPPRFPQPPAVPEAREA